MRRIRWNRGSKWEPDWVRRCGRGQTDQGEVLDDCLSRDFRFGNSPLRGHVIIINCNQLKKNF